jgi:hypothetical protein
LWKKRSSYCAEDGEKRVSLGLFLERIPERREVMALLEIRKLTKLSVV